MEDYGVMMVLIGKAKSFASTYHRRCWISGNQDIYRFVFFYGPLLAIILFNAISIVYVWKAMSVETHTKKFVMNLALYPIVMVICWTGAFANRIHVYITNEPSLGFQLWD